MAAEAPSVPASSARYALFGAVVATVGDFCLLYVGNTGGGGIGVILAGALLGIVGIPLYALGYSAAARPMRAGHLRLARTVSVAGGLGAIAGAAIHALTGVLIYRGFQGGTLGGDPLEAVAQSGPLLPALWAVAALLVLIASGALVYGVIRGGHRALRLPALLNPVFGTVVIAGVGLVAGPAQDYVVPAAPNLAHVLFFALLAAPWRLK